MRFIKQWYIAIFVFSCLVGLSRVRPVPPKVVAQSAEAWSQWGGNAQHAGASVAVGQSIKRQLADLVIDPFVKQEVAEQHGPLTVHYQVPLLSGQDVFMEFKTGSYTPCVPPGSGQPFPCGPNAWNTEIWNDRAFEWQNGQLVQLWNFQTDWTPEPNDYSLGGYEPVFQPALAAQFVYVPGSGGTLYKLSQADGSVASHINPFNGVINANTFVSGPVSADALGNIYYNAIQLNLSKPWGTDVLGSWLVKVAPDDGTSTVSYQALVPNPPTSCLGTFSTNQLPWPPSPNAVPGSISCGSQRAALNVAPAITPDGQTIYTVSHAHFTSRYAYLMAVNSSLTLKWAASLRGNLNDGCNVLLPANGQPGGCRAGATTGVDPTQNTSGAGMVSDQATSSPVVAPDGSILFGVNTAYNYGRGHLLKFSPAGQFLASYDFGWDTTPAIFAQGSAYSIVIKDNHYDSGSYCSNTTWCPKAPPGPYFITRLDTNLVPQWEFENTTINIKHPNGYEWCINAPVVDPNGTVYANSEDGNLYVISQGGTLKQSIKLKMVLAAAYTPLSIGADGKVYTLNDGHLLAVGN